MLLQRSLAWILQELLTSEKTCKNLTRTELKVEENLASSRKNLARKKSDLLKTFFARKMNKSGFSCKNLPRILHFMPFLKSLAISCKNNALSSRSCKKLPRILQVLSDRLTRVYSFWNENLQTESQSELPLIEQNLVPGKQSAIFQTV